ncbi:type IVB secretion system protein IcmH/DotU [Kangiella koreensis]|nr:type IVB secretion system protein IcmH/DotU [Kangiella koreensis]
MDRTILVPRPGGVQRPLDANEQTLEPDLSRSQKIPLSAFKIGVNPIIDAATTLLSLAIELKQATQINNINMLHKQCMNHIKEFEQQLRQDEISSETIAEARYAICSLIDEIVLNSPWGANSIWSTKSLLSVFYKQTWGGEQFYKIIHERVKVALNNQYLLELMYLCLQLGFKGKYQVEDNGFERLEMEKEQLYAVLKKLQPEQEKDLSPRWRSNVTDLIEKQRAVPLWAVGILTVTILLGLYMSFSYQLSQKAEPVYNSIASLVPENKVDLASSDSVINYAKNLRQLLSTEIGRGLLQVVEDIDHVAIIITSNQMYSSASAQLNENSIALIEKIGQIATTTPGHIQVVGHSDDQKIFTAKYHSNWELSLARANSVVRILNQNQNLAGRVTAEGRGAAEPRVANDTDTNRALNRRVEILLWVKDKFKDKQTVEVSEL